MRSPWLASAGVALACLPCLLVLLVAAGIGTSALSAIASALSEPGLAVAAGLLAAPLFAGAAIVFVRRRAEAGCEADLTPVESAGDPRGTRGSRRRTEARRADEQPERPASGSGRSVADVGPEHAEHLLLASVEVCDVIADRRRRLAET